MNPVSPLELVDSGKTIQSSGSAFSFDASSVSQYLREVARDKMNDGMNTAARPRSSSLPLAGFPYVDTRHERKRKIDKVLLGDTGPIPSVRRQMMATTHSFDAICKTFRVEVYSALDWQKPLSSPGQPDVSESQLVVAPLRHQLARMVAYIHWGC